MQNSLFDHFYNIGVIPVLEIDRIADAVSLALALLASWLPVAEVTLRTGAALKAIEEVTLINPDMNPFFFILFSSISKRSNYL